MRYAKGWGHSVKWEVAGSYLHGAYGLAQWFPNFSWHQTPVEGLLDPTFGIFDSGGLGWDLRICISSQLPGDADMAGPGTTLCEALV